MHPQHAAAHLGPWPGPRGAEDAGELRAWRSLSPSSWYLPLPKSEIRGGVGSQGCRPATLAGSAGASFCIVHLPSPFKPPCFRHAKGAIPVDPRRCGLDGLNLQEVGLRGDVVRQSGQPLTTPMSFPGSEGGPVPLGAHPEGAWLVEGPWRAGLLAGRRRAGTDLL